MTPIPGGSRHGDPPRRSLSRTIAVISAAFCLLLPIAAVVAVPSYARITPALGGIPFFYWYQLAWLLFAAAMTGLAYALLRRTDPETEGEE